MKWLVFEGVSGKYWLENKAVGECGLEGGVYTSLFLNISPLSLVRRKPEPELKGQNLKTNPTDWTTSELFTLCRNKDEISRNTVFITTIRIKESTASDT